MTLAMAVRAVDGLVLATDSRITGRAGTADISEKFLQVNRDIGVLTYGLAQPGYDGISKLVSEVNRNKWAHFSKISQEASRIFKNAYDSWLNAQKKQQFVAPVGFILGGYDNLETNQFVIVHYEIVPTPEEPNGAIEVRPMPGDLLAAQWQISRYLLNKFYREGMTVNELAELVVFSIIETMSIEEGVGGPIQMAIITQNTGFQRLHRQRIADILDKNQLRFSNFIRFIREALFGVK
ncbi:MAG: hypothetical protein ABII68_12280 [Pseudomonadota bacterium]